MNTDQQVYFVRSDGREHSLVEVAHFLYCNHLMSFLSLFFTAVLTPDHPRGDASTLA